MTKKTSLGTTILASIIQNGHGRPIRENWRQPLKGLKVKQLILGGARSGKTGFGENAALEIALAKASIVKPTYLATAQAFDDEMVARIARHRADRADRFVTIEEPLALAEALLPLSKQVVMVDCLTLWLSNVLLDGQDVNAASVQLCSVVSAFDGDLLLISNEVGWGIVPETPLGRAFRDAQGRLNQDIAQVCETVTLVVAGLPLALKGT